MSTMMSRQILHPYLVWTCARCHGEHTVLLSVDDPSKVGGGSVFTVEQEVTNEISFAASVIPEAVVTEVRYRLTVPVDLSGCLALPRASGTQRMSLEDRVALHRAVGSVILDPDERDALYRVLEREGLT